MIPVFDQSKRRQMAKELSILYQNLKLSPRVQHSQVTHGVLCIK